MTGVKVVITQFCFEGPLFYFLHNLSIRYNFVFTISYTYINASFHCACISYSRGGQHEVIMIYYLVNDVARIVLSYEVIPFSFTNIYNIQLCKDHLILITSTLDHLIHSFALVFLFLFQYLYTHTDYLRPILLLIINRFYFLLLRRP